MGPVPVPMYEREEKTFEKNLAKSLDRARTALRKLCAREFACEPDACRAAEIWLNKHPRYQFRNLDIATITHKQEKKRGRPKNGEPVQVSYKITAETEHNPAVLAEEQRSSGDLSWQRTIQSCQPTNCSPTTKDRGRWNAGFGS
jgi:transposase